MSEKCPKCGTELIAKAFKRSFGCLSYCQSDGSDFEQSPICKRICELESQLAASQAECERLKKGIGYWSYCTYFGMSKECPELSGTLAEFFSSVGISSYSHDATYDAIRIQNTEIARLRSQLEEARRDTERLDWLEKYSTEIGWNDEEPQERCVWKITGRNDREWDLAGQGETVRAAIDAAAGKESNPCTNPYDRSLTPDAFPDAAKDK